MNDDVIGVGVGVLNDTLDTLGVSANDTLGGRLWLSISCATDSVTAVGSFCVGEDGDEYAADGS